MVKKTNNEQVICTINRKDIRKAQILMGEINKGRD